MIPNCKFKEKTSYVRKRYMVLT